ncbi:MAG: transcriptional repressor LexA [Acidobacteriota bacterium]
MITKKQKGFLEKLRAKVISDGYFPSVRDICEITGLSSPATVHSYLTRLVENGYLRRDGRSWIVVSGRTAVPLVGIVPAGSPLEIFESLGEEVELPEWMVDKGGDKVALRVQGESMRDAYIREGDIVIIKKTPDAESGDMVVALMEDSTITLKRLKKREGSVWLIPENPEFEPIHDPFELVGKVIGVLRRY